MMLLQDDPAIQLAFSIRENKGVFAVLLGSGLSRSAGIPTGWEITLDLIRTIAVAKGVKGAKNFNDQTCVQWYQEQTGKAPNYSEILNDMARSSGERRAILQRYIEPDEKEHKEGMKMPTPAHHAIAQLVAAGYIRVIITTNFDRLMESALKVQNIEPTVIGSEDALAGAEPLVHSRCTVFKLHGDYKDARILNTEEELENYPSAYNKLLDQILDEYGLIVCGWSGEWDIALRNAFLRASNRCYPVYWATCEKWKPELPAQKLVAHRCRSTNIIQIESADKFFGALQHTIEILDQYQRQNPLSVELLVSSTKRYLAKLEHRIQLEELFAQETERLFAKIDESNLVEEPNFCTRVQLYESMTEPLACISGALGRWGGQEEFGMVVNLLQTLYHHADRTNNGLPSVNEIHDYPAVLIFTAYGIGLIKAERWATLFKLFSFTLTSACRGSQRIVSTFFLDAWDSYNESLWKRVESLRMPLSEHLLKIMMRWQRSFVREDANFALLFSRFEILGSLVHFHEHYANMAELVEKETGLKRQNDKSKLLAEMPMGRAAWDNEIFPILLQELASSTQVERLRQAGFTKDKMNDRFFKLFIENFTRHRYVRRSYRS